MADQKLDNLLNLALDATGEEREKSINLSVGSEKDSQIWDVIVKYSGDIEALSGDGIQAVPLLGGFAVVSLPRNRIRDFAGHPQVEFMELPKRLYFQVRQGLEVSCFRPVQEEEGLSGQGVLVAKSAERIPARSGVYQRGNQPCPVPFGTGRKSSDKRKRLQWSWYFRTWNCGRKWKSIRRGKQGSGL